MRRSAVMQLGGVRRVLALALALAAAGGCEHVPACDGVACMAACPRDATVDASGHCTCIDGEIALLGACVSPPIADTYCGKAARADPRGGGCAFRACTSGEVLDVATGECTPRASLPHGGAASCPEGSAPITLAGHASCALRDATCPRGARSGKAGAPADAKSCVAPPICPPGTLAEDDGCRPVVTSGGRTGRRIDLGTWARLVLGVDGGRGATALCQPLASRPDAFFGDRNTEDSPPAVRVDVVLQVPDEDISRVHAEVHAEFLERGGPALPHALSPTAEALVSDTVSSSVELLRGLGGEASAAAVELEVTCAIAP